MSIIRPYRLYKDIDLSFSPHPQTGDVAKKLDVNAVKQSLKTLLFTQFSERLFQPKIGSPLYTLLFEPMDPITIEGMKQAIELLIQNYEPRIILERVDVVPLYDENSYDLSIFFTVTGIPLPISFSTILQRLR
jgi:phage baseplate assembly protein W